LASHFSEADRTLKSQIDTSLANLRSAYGSIQAVSPYDSARFYREFRASYNETSKAFVTAQKLLLEEMGQLSKALQEKKSKTSEVVRLQLSLTIKPYLDAITALNAVIAKHNAKSRDFGSAQTAAVNRQCFENSE